MKTFDWIVIGAGITGAALAYELVRQGFSVLVLEQHATLAGATRFGYGGIACWAGTTDLTRQLCRESRARYPTLSAELETDIQYRELDLLLTLPPDAVPEQVAATYTTCEVPPQLLTVAAACDREPLLNPAAIGGALLAHHGHIHSLAAVQGYCQQLTHRGGTYQIETVLDLVRQGDRILGVRTATATYGAENVVVCAGGISRALLKQAGIPVRIYFTHAEVIETPPVNLRLQTMLMPAQTDRYRLEGAATRPELDTLWDQPGQEPVPPILDVGIIQFLDGSLRIGQISRVLTDPYAQPNPVQSEAEMRLGIGTLLPALQDLPGTWHHCLVAFSHDRLPLIGPLPGLDGIHLFSGFSNPLAIVPPLAQRFAQWANDRSDPLIPQLSPARLL
ncbi:FAD-dependent oxidoreductase [Leptolyngbya sp. 'hensonii']|uniref:NAD(P)/FAD-dependent oxidoreductase n=1 Tax=Leptolyngbya sp. 'hensonii' TaxID=1922337 RepID=UPI00094F72C1|nr:FAD-binding oxidoreductase [Leptolyngbya sp. 'hensonii']OLP17141.1 FAD-dependent oxidoreductase [Leptolyngbya sp. 'hensonii']